MTALNPDLPTARAHEFNFTIEHEVVKDTVVRAGFIGTAGRNLEMMELFNRNPVSNYVWYATTGLALPTGKYANTARRAYDQTVIGDIRVYSKFGYSNFSGIQLEAERRFSKGTGLPVLLRAEQLHVHRQPRRLRAATSPRTPSTSPTASCRAPIPPAWRTARASIATRAMATYPSTTSASTTCTTCRSAAARNSPATSVPS